MSTTRKVLCWIVSAMGIVCSALCLWYIATAAIGVLGANADVDAPPRFREWYLALSTISAIIAVGVAAGCFDLARLKIRGAQLVTIFSILPLPLMMIVGLLCLSPAGMSIASATGVSLGGLMPMLLSLLPVWAGLLWLLAFRNPQQPESNIP